MVYKIPTRKPVLFRFMLSILENKFRLYHLCVQTERREMNTVIKYPNVCVCV